MEQNTYIRKLYLCLTSLDSIQKFNRNAVFVQKTNPHQNNINVYWNTAMEHIRI